MTVWFTSDWHFGHQNILEYTDRPYRSIDEHDEALIENYNNRVQQGDVCYFLGDMFFSCSTEKARDYLSRMCGTKILIKGNHDKNKDLWYYSIGFDVVLESAKIRLGQKIVHLSHYPFRAPWYKRLYWHIKSPKYRNYKSRKYRNVPNDGNYLLHGHTHTNKKINGRAVHVGLDAWDCKPVSATEILELINKEHNE
jgi:calcineurin-like phosphoesterase family protein